MRNSSLRKALHLENFDSDELTTPLLATLESLASRNSPRSVFFIYAKHGQGGSETKPNRNFYAVAGQPKEIWEVPVGDHTRGLDVRPKEYERRVVGFFDRALLESR